MKRKMKKRKKAEKRNLVRNEDEVPGDYQKWVCTDTEKNEISYE